jgi:hypothetical protein
LTELPSGLVGLCLLSILGAVLFLSLKMRQRFGKLDRIQGRNAAAQKHETDQLKKSLNVLIAREKNLAEREAKYFDLLNRSITTLRGDLKKQSEALSRQSEKLSKQAEASKKERASLRELGSSLKHIQEGQIETRYIQALSALPLKYPVFCGRWAIDGFLAKELMDHLAIHRPRVVLELGSGVSTVLIASALESLGLTDTRHIAVDHLDEFLENTRKMVDCQGLKRTTEYWHCPLSSSIAPEASWYHGIPGRLGTTRIDLLLVDGPPGTLRPGARRPVLPVLRQFLSENAVVLLDDAGRDEEQEVLARWKDDFPELIEKTSKLGKGFSRITMSPATKKQAPVNDGNDKP